MSPFSILKAFNPYYFLSSYYFFLYFVLYYSTQQYLKFILGNSGPLSSLFLILAILGQVPEPFTAKA